MTESAIFGRRLLVAVDVRGYGGSDDRRQERIQRHLSALLDAAAQRSGLDRTCWQRQVAGDGELALLPATEPEPRVVDDLPRHLAHELAQLNADMLPERRLRLRMAVHHGSAAPAAMGYSGQGVVVVSRLLDSAPLRQALDGADLAVMLSAAVYDDVVLNGHTSLRPEQCTPVLVMVKELQTKAYLLVPGSTQAVPLPDGSGAAAVSATPAVPGGAGDSGGPAPAGQSVDARIRSLIADQVHFGFRYETGAR